MKTWKVLIADDETAARVHLKSLLASYPDLAISQCAASGAEALARLTREEYDLAFLDIGMPGRTGLEVLRALRQAGSATPYVIFVTAWTTHGAEAYELGAVDYLVKPVSETRLAEAMRRFRIHADAPRGAAGQGGWMRETAAGEGKSSVLETLLVERFGLTAREAEICSLVKEGLVREEIQDHLGLSDGTMKTHLSHIYDKIGLEGGEGGRGDKFSRLLYLLFTLE
jgi:DNA-binding NarL/FixJ family response regulator